LGLGSLGPGSLLFVDVPFRSSNVLIGFGKVIAFANHVKVEQVWVAAEVIRECTRWRTRSGVTSVVVRAEPMSTLDAELNDFGAQLAMLGAHAADCDG
jgi:hypothetical protein